MNRVVIGVGSNVDPSYHVALSEKLLSQEQVLIQCSRFCRTPPIGKKDQPDFWNGAYLVETDLNFDDFRAYIKKLEKKIGRTGHADKWGPREIDFDIVVWNGRIIGQDYYERDFVRNAVLEVLPNLNQESKRREPQRHQEKHWVKKI